MRHLISVTFLFLTLLYGLAFGSRHIDYEPQRMRARSTIMEWDGFGVRLSEYVEGGTEKG
jgi:hypothetical protein